MFSVPNPGYKIEKNPIGRQAAVRLHGLNKTQYCTGRIRFAARSLPQSPLVPFRLFPQFPTPSVRQNLTTLHFDTREEDRALVLYLRDRSWRSSLRKHEYNIHYGSTRC